MAPEARKIIARAMFADGVTIGGKSSLDVDKDGAQMELLPYGLAVSHGGKRWIVPTASVRWMLLPDEKGEK